MGGLQTCHCENDMGWRGLRLGALLNKGTGPTGLIPLWLLQNQCDIRHGAFHLGSGLRNLRVPF